MISSLKQAAVVDDDVKFLEFAVLGLARANYHVLPFTSGVDLMNSLREHQPGIVLLDRLLPDCDGFSLCRQIKDLWPELPVLMFSSEGDAEDIISGLSIGADDYLPKPFSAEMLIAKTEAVSRRYALYTRLDNCIRIGDLNIQKNACRAFIGQKMLPLTKTEFQLLACLASNQGMVVTRKEILERILGYQNVVASMESNVAFHVNNLREKLGDYRACIQTVRGFGYRFHAPGHPERQVLP